MEHMSMRSAHKSPRYAVGVLLAATAVAAAACSSSAGSSSAPASTGTSASSASASAPGTVTNVTLGYVPYSDDASLFYAQSSGILSRSTA